MLPAWLGLRRGAMFEKVHEAKAWVRRTLSLHSTASQLDAFLLPGWAKAPFFVAGNANILVFPNLEAGNSVFCSALRGAEAANRQGIARPVNDLSCSAR